MPPISIHRSAPQAADAPISIRKGMNVVQTVVGRRDCHDPRRLAHVREAIASLEVPHEVVDTFAGWRHLASDGGILLGATSPFARLHVERHIDAAYPQHRLGRVAIEISVKRADEFRRRRLRKSDVGRHAIDFGLDPNVGGGLELKITPPFILIDIAGQSAFNISRSGIVAFHEIALVSDHDAGPCGEICRGCRMERRLEDSTSR